LLKGIISSQFISREQFLECLVTSCVRLVVLASQLKRYKKANQIKICEDFCK